METMHEMIARHRSSADDRAISAALADALNLTGPVITDDGEVFFRGNDGALRSFRIGELRPARAVEVPSIAPATVSRKRTRRA